MRCSLTDAFGEPLAPLWPRGIPVVAGEEAVSRERVAFGADVLDGRAHQHSGV